MQSLILSIMVLGVYISYKILDFPDLFADGSFPLGAAIISIMLKRGVSPITASLFALSAGLIDGLLTGVLHVKLKISNLLSGNLIYVFMLQDMHFLHYHHLEAHGPCLSFGCSHFVLHKLYLQLEVP